MRIGRRRALTVLAAFGAGALLPTGAVRARESAHWSGIALGAPASLTIAGRTPAESERLIAAARAEIERLEDVFSLYRPESALARLNRDGALDAPPADLVVLLSRAATIHAATRGAFDPTVQPVWRLLAETGGRPEPSAMSGALARIGWDGVSVTPGRVRFARPGMALTLNGVAQGYITDRVAALLRDEGLDSVLVAVGEIAANGPRAAGVPWQVGIAEHGDQAAEESIALSDGAIATSAPLGTSFDTAGTLGHILDPQRGIVASRWRRISVIHPSATIADGLSTGLALATPTEIRTCLASIRGGRVIAMGTDGVRVDLGGSAQSERF